MGKQTIWENNTRSNIGCFFVLDGTDGTGKTTQIKLLKKRLENNGYQVKMADFPQYNTKSAGLIEEYLGGKYGELDEVSPYAASLFYSLDRFDASHVIKKWIQNGFIVLSNRYTTANLGHQGAKIDSPLARKAFYDWVEQIEYKILRLPRPDKTVILRMPAEVAQSLSNKRQRVDWSGKVRDIHEENLRHLRKAERIFSELSEILPNTGIIDCFLNGNISSINKISDQVWQEISPFLPGRPRAQDYREAQVSCPDIPDSRLDPSCIAPKETGSSDKTDKPRVIKTRDEKPKYAIDIASDREYIVKKGQILEIKPGYRSLLPEKYLGYVLTPAPLLKSNIKIQTQILHPGTDSELAIIIKNNSAQDYIIIKGQTIAQVLFHKLELIQGGHYGL